MTALWSGLGPSLARGFFFGGARLGMYTPIKNILIGDEKPTFAMKVAAGSISGGVAAAITSPIELIKVSRLPGPHATCGGSGTHALLLQLACCPKP